MSRDDPAPGVVYPRNVEGGQESAEALRIYRTLLMPKMSERHQLGIEPGAHRPGSPFDGRVRVALIRNRLAQESVTW